MAMSRRQESTTITIEVYFIGLLKSATRYSWKSNGTHWSESSDESMPPWTCWISCSEVHGFTSLSHIDLPDVHKKTLTMEYAMCRTHARNCRIYMTTLSFCAVERPSKTFLDRPKIPRQQLELEVFFWSFDKFSWLSLHGKLRYYDALYSMFADFLDFDPYNYFILFKKL